MKRRIQPYHLANVFGKIGYTVLLVLWLLVVSLVVTQLIAAVIYSGTPHVGGQLGVYDQLDYGSYTPDAPQDLPVAAKIGLGAVALAIFAILTHFTGTHSSNVLRKILRRLSIKQTHGSMFAAKFIALGGGFVALSAIGLIFPDVAVLQPVMTVVTVVGAVSFGLQLALVRRRKLAVKNVL